MCSFATRCSNGFSCRPSTGKVASYNSSDCFSSFKEQQLISSIRSGCACTGSPSLLSQVRMTNESLIFDMPAARAYLRASYVVLPESVSMPSSAMSAGERKSSSELPFPSVQQSAQQSLATESATAAGESVMSRAPSSAGMVVLIVGAPAEPSHLRIVSASTSPFRSSASISANLQYLMRSPRVSISFPAHEVSIFMMPRISSFRNLPVPVPMCDTNSTALR